MSAASAGEVRRTHRVLVFTTPACPWCNRAKAYLRERHVSGDGAQELIARL